MEYKEIEKLKTFLREQISKKENDLRKKEVQELSKIILDEIEKETKDLNFFKIYSLFCQIITILRAPIIPPKIS